MKKLSKPSAGFFIIVLALAFSTTLIAQSEANKSTKMVELILDASGSMNGRLSDGQMKIVAAKAAVAQIAENLPDSLVLAFRAYGHQSPREKKDCLDTQLLVDFSELEDIRLQIIEGSKDLKAQGYTPITYVLGEAAEDFPKDESDHILILVSDGKETCEGDPCVTARKLKENDISLTVHTIGFGVDAATKSQLDCIAKMTGGKYFDANSLEELIQVLAEAVETAATMTVESQGEGWLMIEGADLRGHEVIDPNSGEQVGFISNTNSTIEIPAGIYNVTVANATWKSVEVKAGETTVLKPGWLNVNHASFRGHAVLDAETGEEHGHVSSLASSITLMPGVYDVTFGGIQWRATVNASETTTLNAGLLSVDGASYRGHTIRTADGTEVGYVSNTAGSFTLPPGDYTVEIGGKAVPFTLKEGQELTLKVE